MKNNEVFDRITVNPEVMVGKPTIRRFRITPVPYPSGYQEPGNRENSQKTSGFFQRFKKKWGLGFILALILATLWLIMGTGIITGGEKYAMWYSGKPGSVENPGGGIGYAASSDGIKWNAPVFDMGSADWEKTKIFVTGINFTKK